MRSFVSLIMTISLIQEADGIIALENSVPRPLKSRKLQQTPILSIVIPYLGIPVCDDRSRRFCHPLFEYFLIAPGSGRAGRDSRCDTATDDPVNPTFQQFLTEKDFCEERFVSGQFSTESVIR